jgi:TolB protein
MGGQMVKRYAGLTLLCLGWLISINAHARLTIEITGGTEGALPIAVVPFGWEGTELRAPVDIASIVAADLHRSGRFTTMPEQEMLSKPTRPEMVNFRNWRALNQEALVVGRMQEVGAGRYAVRFQLFDVFKGDRLADYTIEAKPSELRHSAHRISDIIYEKLTGEPGAFSTRIAYVAVSNRTGKPPVYALQVADADGYDPRTIVTSSEPILSPAWSPDGKRLAYVSFETKRSVVFVQTLSSGAREKVAGFPGINGAPAWSPDGRQIALTLSKDGNPDIYILNLTTRALRKLTRNSAIDTEPTWSRDGRQIVFTSDRGGRPQLYSISVFGGKAKRLTFEGDYNAGGIFSPDGDRLALVHGNRGDFRIAVLDLATGGLSVLTQGKLDESPSFAPNGSMILYADGNNERSHLSAVSADGRVHQRLILDGGEVREPAWSPL